MVAFRSARSIAGGSPRRPSARCCAGSICVWRSRPPMPRGCAISARPTLPPPGISSSTCRKRGQTPVEPIKLGAAILHGPHVWNFAEIYSALDAAHGAEQVADAGKLAVRVGAWLTDAGERSSVVAAARRTVATLGGALEHTVAA